MVAKLRAPGLASSGPGAYEHTQSIASTTWTIVHNFGRYPAAVAVRLLSGDFVEADRHDIDVNTTVLTFLTAAAGVAEAV